MVYFNCVQDDVSVHRGSFFPFLISTVSVQRIKMFYSLDSKVAKSEFSTMTCMREAS